MERKTESRRVFLPTFYLRRFLRVWPPWFFAFCVSLLAKKFLFSHPVTQPETSKWLAGFWHAKLTASDFFLQCLFLLHDSPRLLLNQDWSLGVELKGSALIPLFLICARPKYVASIFPVGLFLLIFVGTGHYYVTFLIGVLVAQYEIGWVSWLEQLPMQFRAVLGFCGLLLYQSYDFLLSLFPGSHSAIKYGWVLSAVGCAVLLVSVLASQTLRQILDHKPFVFLGRISYSVYLLQFIIILCLLPLLVNWLNKSGITQPWILFPTTILASIFATICLASIMFRWIEVPVINFSHWLTKRIQARWQT